MVFEFSQIFDSEVGLDDGRVRVRGGDGDEEDLMSLLEDVFIIGIADWVFISKIEKI
jgi:hypothetical protein